MKEFDIEFEVNQKFTYAMTVQAETPQQAVELAKHEDFDRHEAEERGMIESFDDTDTIEVVGERITSPNGVGSHRIDIVEEPKNFGSHIAKAISLQTGGGVMVDYLTLTDDYRLGVTEEVICLLVSGYDEEGDERDQLASVDICLYGAIDMIDYDGGSLTFIDEMTVLSDDGIIQYDVITLKNGIVITIDDAQVIVYEKYTDMSRRTVFSIGEIQRP
jgi:hypothetical protein